LIGNSRPGTLARDGEGAQDRRRFSCSLVVEKEESRSALLLVAEAVAQTTLQSGVSTTVGGPHPAEARFAREMGRVLEIGAILLPISHHSPRSDLQRLSATASVLSERPHRFGGDDRHRAKGTRTIQVFGCGFPDGGVAIDR